MSLRFVLQDLGNLRECLFDLDTQEIVVEVQDFSDVELKLYRIRQLAAHLYRNEGYWGFAERVENGKLDDCQGIRLARAYLS